MKVVLLCGTCGARLTEPLRFLSGKNPSVARPARELRKSRTQQGTVYKSSEPIVQSFGNLPEPLDFSPQHWVHPHDLTSNVVASSNTDSLSGCCGLAGMSGPNQVCTCGAEIGTLQSDCGTDFVFISQPGTTIWERVFEDYQGAVK